MGVNPPAKPAIYLAGRRWYGRWNVNFRLLGLLEVVGDDGRTVDIVRGHESALLALLLLHANEAVSPERIVDELWPVAPPENARKSIHIYISRLRKAIGPARIDTTPVGYLLHVDPGELDVTHFETLVRAGREALARSAPEDAESLFDRALALWRVAPLADFRFESFAQSETRRLQELHDTVVADRVDARIACGRANLVIQELAALIEQAPLWERPRAQLMRAFYLTGRQADALELYRRTRELLDDELGVEPGIELQRLERQILNHDPELGEPTPPPTPRTRRRRMLRRSLGLVCVLVMAILAGTFVFSRGAAPSSIRPNVHNPTQAVSTIDPATNRVASTTHVGRYPARIVASRNAVWILDTQDDTISRIDPSTRLVVHTFTPGSVVSDIEAYAGSLWAAAPHANRVLRLDATTDGITSRIVAPSALLLASGRGLLWVSGTHLLTVDPKSEKSRVVSDRQYIAGKPSSYGTSAGIDANTSSTVMTGRWWFFDDAGGVVLRVDPATGKERQSRHLVGFDDATRMIAAQGALWLSSADRDALLRMDPDTLAWTMKVAVGSRPVGVTYGAGSLWVANSGAGTVTRIDPADGRVQATISVGGTPFDMTFARGLVWVTLL